MENKQLVYGRNRVAFNKAMRFAMVFFLVLAYLFMGFWPFVWWLAIVHNSARWSDEQTLRFQPQGLARAPAAPSWLKTVAATDRLDVRLRVRPLEGRNPPAGTIMAISHDSYEGNLRLFQVNEELHIYVRLSGIPDGHELIELPSVFSRPEETVEIGFTINPQQVRVDINGNKVFTKPIWDGALKDWDRSFQLTFGNERGGNSPWFGEIAEAQFITQGFAQDYVDPQLLEIPETYWQMGVWPRWNPFDQMHYGDLAVNFAGFVPFGFVVGWLLKRRRVFIVAVISGAALSAFIELVQLGIVDRYTSTADFLMNIAGCALGAGLSPSRVVS